MNIEQTFPRIQSVKVFRQYLISVLFRNGIVKVYDCKKLLTKSAFKPLTDQTLFMQAHADPHGYGVIWNDEIDLAESEIWINGEVVEQEFALDREQARDQ